MPNKLINNPYYKSNTSNPYLREYYETLYEKQKNQELEAQRAVDRRSYEIEKLAQLAKLDRYSMEKYFQSIYPQFEDITKPPKEDVKKISDKDLRVLEGLLNDLLK